MPTKRKPTTRTKTNLRGVVKKKITGGGVKLKQKTKPSGKQKVKGVVATKGRRKYMTREKGTVKSKKK
jgi:hypothetical protein